MNDRLLSERVVLRHAAACPCFEEYSEECCNCAAQDDRAEIAKLEADARIVADFITGWWPGLEDGIHWGTAEVDGRHPAYAAAARLRTALGGDDE